MLGYPGQRELVREQNESEKRPSAQNTRNGQS